MFKGLKSCIFKKLSFSWKSPYFRVSYHLKEIDWLLTELRHGTKFSYCSSSFHHLGVFQTSFESQKVLHHGINFFLKTATLLCKIIDLKRDFHQARCGQRGWQCCSEAFKRRIRIAVSWGAFIFHGWISVPRWRGAVVLFIHTSSRQFFLLLFKRNSDAAIYVFMKTSVYPKWPSVVGNDHEGIFINKIKR